jgi:hypothetical protein
MLKRLIPHSELLESFHWQDLSETIRRFTNQPKLYVLILELPDFVVAWGAYVLRLSEQLVMLPGATKYENHHLLITKQPLI